MGKTSNTKAEKEKCYHKKKKTCVFFLFSGF